MPRRDAKAKKDKSQKEMSRNSESCLKRQETVLQQKKCKRHWNMEKQGKPSKRFLNSEGGPISHSYAIKDASRQ